MEPVFGEYIKQIRSERGMTLKDLSAHLKVDTANLSKIENGQRSFDEKKIPMLCDALGVSETQVRQEFTSCLWTQQVLEQNLNIDDLIGEVRKKIEHHNSVQMANAPLDDDWRTKDFKYPDTTIRVGTLFSGIGAFEHALHRLKLKHKIVFAGDIDPFVKENYFKNYDITEKSWHNDVTKFSAKRYRDKVDIVVGGSPCQAFSMVGKRRGLQDVRGTLFYEFARVISESQPKMFIFENVKGLLNHDGGRTWSVVQEVFSSLGYRIYSDILNSKDYGIPQHRERIFVIGFKDNNVNFHFPEKIPLETKMQDFLEDYTDSRYYLKEKGVKFVTSSKNKNKCYTQINGEVMLCQKANQQFNWHGDFVFESVKEKCFDEFVFDVNSVEEKYYLSDKVKSYVLANGTKNFRTSTKTDLEIARPLLQTMHKMHRAGVDNYVTHNKGKIRKLTPRECLRLMGFRDDFKISVSDTQMYRQAGNSIVVDVFIAILKQLDITKYGER
jgi:DNA (cytosine-5)-methyltransferase 1